LCTVASQLLLKLFTISHSAAAANSSYQPLQYSTLHTALLLLNRDYTAVAAYLDLTLFGSCSSNYSSSSSSSSSSIGSSSSAAYASPRKQQQQQQQQRQQQYVNLADGVQTVAVTHEPFAQKPGVLFEKEGLLTGLTTVRAIASTSSTAAAADTAAMSEMLAVTEAFPVHQNGYSTTTTADASDTVTTSIAWLRAAVLAAAVVALPVPVLSSSSYSSISGSSTCAVRCMYEAMKQRLLMVPLQERQSMAAARSGSYYYLVLLSCVFVATTVLYQDVLLLCLSLRVYPIYSMEESTVNVLTL
jgi:hypothetical protein